jgi:hypothetical protein
MKQFKTERDKKDLSRPSLGNNDKNKASKPCAEYKVLVLLMKSIAINEKSII